MNESWKWDHGTLVDQDGKIKAQPIANGRLTIECDSGMTKILIANAPQQAQKLAELELLLVSALCFSGEAVVRMPKNKLTELTDSIRETLAGTEYARK